MTRSIVQMAPTRPSARSWRVRDGDVRLEPAPLLMAVLNCTPDSFSDGGLWSGGWAVEHAQACVRAGATIIDVGGESTRPGAERIDAPEQIRRTEGVIRALVAWLRAEGRSDVAVSIDTTRAAVARAAIDAGARIINDVSACTEDAELAPLAAAEGAGLVLMHRVLDPTQDRWSHEHRASLVEGDIVDAVAAALAIRVASVVASGVPMESIAIDPGLGFGKTVQENLSLIAGTARFVAMGHPVLVGASRKSFVGAITGEPDPARRVAGSVAMHLEAAAGGAHLLRVHDVAEHAQALAAWRAIRDHR
ncbi:MAG: dihydropteroate synthase [Planctomycetes bacterium]|nr:dihydropteroate synthase [Planctomycetota bacterium]